MMQVADIDGDGQYEVIVKRVNGDFTVANDSGIHSLRGI